MATIQLNDDSMRLIEERLGMGPYKNADDAVQAGLLSLKADEHLQRLIQQGEDDIAAGRFHEFGDGDDMVQFIVDLSQKRKQSS